MKQAKPLTREQYMRKFSRSARWRLSPQDAEDAIRDYQEMVFQEERDESKLVEELGDPVQAVWLLTDAKEYKSWIRMFAALALGLLLMAKWSWTGLTFFQFSWTRSYGSVWYSIAVLAVGIVLSQVWFRMHGQKSGTLSRRLFLSLAAVGIFVLGTIALTWYVLSPKFLEIYAETYTVDSYVGMYLREIPWQIIIQRELLIDGGTVCSIIALAGLVLARVRDRRWLALYTLALTAAALCIMVEFWVHNMDLTYAIMNNLQAYVFALVIPVGAVGLIGTGVSLC